MFDFLNAPWKLDVAITSINFIEIRNRKAISYSSVIGSSILFTKDYIDFHTESINSSNPRKYHKTVRFPTKYVKYFDFEEFFQNHSNERPTSYTLNFYVEFDFPATVGVPANG